jgi:tetratricopeptide (TPR) repeat protein
LRVGLFYALIYVLWLPLQRPFIRLLSASAERVLSLVEHPPILTGLSAKGNRITLHSYVAGEPQALTEVNFGDLHISIVAALALALSVPQKRWLSRMRLGGLAVALVFLVMLAVCIVQLQWAAESYASTRLGITLYTAREKAVLDWAVRKSSLAAVYLVPAFLFLTAYVSFRSEAEITDAPKSERSRGPRLRWGHLASWRWASVSIAVVVCVGAWLTLVPSRADQSGRISLEGLRKIAALNPSSARAHFNLAFNLEKEDRLDEALDYYQKTLQLNPEHVEAHFGAGNTFFRKGVYDRAAVSYEEVLKRQPGNTDARYNLATTYLNRGLFEQAVQSYEAILKETPDHASAHKNLGESLLGLNLQCDALTHLERSVTLDQRLSVNATLRSQISGLRSICEPRP